VYKTKNDLSPSTRASAIQLLNERLADAIDLMLQAKQAHWNVRGPTFLALHRLFDETAERVENFADLMAERAAALGGVAEGTARLVAKRSTLSEYPLTITAGQHHVDALSSALAQFGKLARKAIDDASGFGDADTADLFTEMSRSSDQTLWMLEVQLNDRV
jgi:starvation-inducible DNA-binding protein